MSDENNEAVEEQDQLGITFDDGEEELQEEQQVAEPGATPEPPTEEPEQKDEKGLSFNDDQQKFIDGKINEMTKETWQEKRAREAAEQEAAELKHKLEELQKTGRPEVPEPPDPYAPNYQELVAERDKKIQEAAAYDQAEAMRSEQALQAQQESLRKQQEQMIETVNSYTERAGELGIDPQSLAAAGNVVSSVGVHDALANHILNDPIGPQITVHLANNLAEMNKINSMDPMSAAIYIEQNIKPGLKPKEKEVPPPPPDHLTGKGQKEGERGPKGATFE